MFKQIAIAAFALLVPTATARADDDLLDQVAIYGSINAIALPCHIEAVDQAANRAVLEAVKTDKEAAELLAKIHRDTQEIYRSSQDKALFCANFVKFSDGHARFAK